MTSWTWKATRTKIADQVHGVVNALKTLENVSVDGFTPEEAELYIAARKSMVELEHSIDLRLAAHQKARPT